MAKLKSIIVLQGTFEGITFVRSAAYGDHVRRKRGTHKEAKLNEAMQASGKRLVTTNTPAQIFQNAIKDYRDGLERGSLWRRLLSMFRRQLKASGTFDFGALEPFEIHTKYPLARFPLIHPEVIVDAQNRMLKVDISYSRHPEFERSSFIDGYQLTAVAVFPNLETESAATVAARSPIIGLKDPVAPIEIRLAIPPEAKTFLVCVRIDGCMGGEVNRTPATMAMRMVKAGKV